LERHVNWRQHYLEHFDRLSQQTFPPAIYEIICELAGWCQWLFDKLERIAELPQAELLEQVQLLGPRFDAYLYTPPERLRERLISNRWSAEGIDRFLATLAECQLELRERFRARGLERIEAEPGRIFEPGVIMRKDAESVATDDPNLHDRIARLDAGDAGYRCGDQVIFPSRAVRYLQSF
jgi:hypothetical protein